MRFRRSAVLALAGVAAVAVSGCKLADNNPGAQDPDTFVNVIRRMLARQAQEAAAAAATCDDEACDV